MEANCFLVFWEPLSEAQSTLATVFQGRAGPTDWTVRWRVVGPTSGTLAGPVGVLVLVEALNTWQYRHEVVRPLQSCHPSSADLNPNFFSQAPGGGISLSYSCSFPETLRFLSCITCHLVLELFVSSPSAKGQTKVLPMFLWNKALVLTLHVAGAQGGFVYLRINYKRQNVTKRAKS